MFSPLWPVPLSHWTWLEISVDLWSSPELTIFGTVLNDNHRRLLHLLLDFACCTPEIVGLLLCVTHSSSQVGLVAKNIAYFYAVFEYFAGIVRKERDVWEKIFKNIIRGFLCYKSKL